MVATGEDVVAKTHTAVVTAILMKRNVLRVELITPRSSNQFGQLDVSIFATPEEPVLLVHHHLIQQIRVVICRNPFVMPDTWGVPVTAQ